MQMENSSTPILYSGLPAQGVQNVPTNAVVEVWIRVEETSEHPVHLHTRRFWIVETSDQGKVQQPSVQHDTVSVPIEGWVKVVYVADEPAVYPLHCHYLHDMVGFFSLIVEGPFTPLTSTPPACPVSSTRFSSSAGSSSLSCTGAGRVSSAAAATLDRGLLIIASLLLSLNALETFVY